MNAQVKAIANPPSRLQLWADAVDRCVTALKQQNHTVRHIDITPDSTVIFIDKAPDVKTLPAKTYGYFATSTDSFLVMQFVMFGVHVRYLKYYKPLVSSAGVH